MSRTHRAPSHQGFTLVELMVTLSVLAILTVIALPTIEGMRERARLRAATDAIHAHLQFARSESIKQGRDLYVSITTGANWCVGITHNAAGCTCNTAGNCVFGPTGATQSRTLLSSEFSVTSITSTVTTIRFDSRRGSIPTPGTLTINGATESQQIAYNLSGQIVAP